MKAQYIYVLGIALQLVALADGFYLVLDNLRYGILLNDTLTRRGKFFWRQEERRQLELAPASPTELVFARRVDF